MKKLSVVLTRPEGQNEILAQCVEDAGHEAVVIPWLTIEPIWTEDDRAVWWGSAVQASTLVFVSAASVYAAIPHALNWPGQLWAVATGPGTAQALRAAGVPEARIRMPYKQFDSEGIWAECADCFQSGTVVAIFRGQSGRAWLGERAIEAGCSVEYLTVYRRIPRVEAAMQLTRLWQEKKVDALVLTNSEAIRMIAPLLPRSLWESVTLWVPHLRIQETAKELGAQHVRLTAGGDAGLCAGLQSWLDESRKKESR